jgi:hypothetical protein
MHDGMYWNDEMLWTRRGGHRLLGWYGRTSDGPDPSRWYGRTSGVTIPALREEFDTMEEARDFVQLICNALEKP